MVMTTLMKFLAFLVVFAALMIIASLKWRAFNYPKPQKLPPVVSASTEDLLVRLQAVLENKAPAVARGLQLGLTDARISALEADGKFLLSDDLRKLYRWHNGMDPTVMVEFLPGMMFPPLEIAIRDRTQRESLGSLTWLQRAAVSVLGGHRLGWLHVMDDGAGDGYFFDPERRDGEGAFFYTFGEVGRYIWFPSLRNFLAGVIEGYETDVFPISLDSQHLEEDYERADKIWQRLAEVYDSLPE